MDAEMIDKAASVLKQIMRLQTTAKENYVFLQNFYF